ncbi:hypothetical protein TNCV_508041 [Trichonephila clavipes]|nr:hypothetical protein TNCV_508041 [Trichonephila clavipes]
MKAHEIHRGKRPVVRMSLSVTLSTIQVAVGILARFQPNLEREHPGGSETSLLFSPSTNLTRGLAARLLFRVPPYRKGLLWDSNPGPTAQQSASLAFILDERPKQMQKNSIKIIPANIKSYD